jgi:hypothetical protein
MPPYTSSHRKPVWVGHSCPTPLTLILLRKDSAFHPRRSVEFWTALRVQYRGRAALQRRVKTGKARVPVVPNQPQKREPGFSR